MTGLGNESQTRIIAEQVAEAAVELYVRKNPPPPPPPIVTLPEPKAEIPAPLKWAAAVVSAIIAAGAVAMCIWVVSTLSDLQQTVTRIDERQQLTGSGTAQRLDKIEERLTLLEQQKREKAE